MNQTQERMRPRFIVVLILAFFAILTFTLQPEPNDQANAHEAPSEKQEEPKTDLARDSVDPIAAIRIRVANSSTAEVSEARLKHASQVLQFANAAETVVSAGWFAQADRIAFFIRIYLGEWELAILPKVKIGRASSIQRLLPPDQLLSPELTQKMAEQIALMAEHLDAMLKTYDELKKYVQDTTIMDEGVLGKRLAAQINKSYERFALARKSYFSLLETESLPAEDLFLAQSPLRRQIIAARGIFALFAEITAQLSRETICREAIIDLQKRLSLLLAYAEEPPFKDSPLKERAFRAFLKSVHIYLSDLDVGVREGFYPHVRKALNNSQLACRTSYNDFAQYLNTH